MPLPAGTGMSRRTFVSGVAGLALSVYGGSLLSPRFLDAGIADASGAQGSRVLVSIFMEGGADSLSILFPSGDPKYRSFRPTLALDPSGGTPFATDPTLTWHPAASSLATLHAEGKLSVLPAVGYTNATTRTSPLATTGRSVPQRLAFEPAGWADTSTASVRATTPSRG